MEDIILNFDGKEFDVKYSQSNYSNIAINDKIYSVELLKKIEDNVFSFSVNQKLITVELDFDEKSNLVINSDGFNYFIEITNSTKRVLEKFIKSAVNSGTVKRTIKAPMPGMINKLYVSDGSLVLEGDKLLIIEAMKMENILKSPISGVIKSLKVNEGTPVNKDEILIEIEPE